MMAMAAVTTEDLERFVQFLDEQVLSGDIRRWKTARNIWGLVSKAFDDAAHGKTLELRVRKDNPATDVRPPDEGTELGKQFLYPSEFVALMSCERLPRRWIELVALSIYLYCRAGELEALHVEDVDLLHRVIHIHRAVDRDHDSVKETKTNSPRRIPIEPHILPLLERTIEQAQVAGRVRLVEMPPLCDLAPRLRKYLEWAGVARAELYRTTETSKQMTWHDLRATAATWLAIRSTPPQMIMALCGHENMETTLGYVRLAAVLHVDPTSVFPPISLPQSLPQGPKTWGAAGGKLSQSLRKAVRPQRDSNPLEERSNVDIQPVSASIEASPCSTSARPSARNVVFGAALGQLAATTRPALRGSLPSPAVAQDTGGSDPDGAAALELVGRHVIAGSLVWDAVEVALVDDSVGEEAGGPR
jgi:integrase